MPQIFFLNEVHESTLYNSCGLADVLTVMTKLNVAWHSFFKTGTYSRATQQHLTILLSHDVSLPPSAVIAKLRPDAVMDASAAPLAPLQFHINIRLLIVMLCQHPRS